MLTPCRLIVDPPQAGAWNMALDEALLEDAADHGTATLRFYQWHEPTLSLGYFQSYQERHSHAPSLDVAVVRRLSGGGALLHDRELTYSICLPSTHPFARDSAALYEVAHGSIIQLLESWDLRAFLHRDKYPRSADDDGGFLCFARRTGTDVILQLGDDGALDAKIVGSAQRRRRGAILQHGGILLGTSAAAPELDGISEMIGRLIEPESIIPPLQRTLGYALGLDLCAEPPSGQILKTAQRLQDEKYAHPLWTQRR